MNEHLRKPIPFVWSWTTLRDFRNCPKRLYEVKHLKNFKDVRSEALSVGDAFHDAMAKRLINKRLLPPELIRYEKLAKWVEGRVAPDGVLRVEMNLAINRNFQPTGSFDPDTWHRSKIDVLIINDERAILIDWKTGKIETDTQQLAINAACAFAFWPDLKLVTTQYVWIAHIDEDTKTYRQTDDHWCMGDAHYRELPSGKTIAVNSLRDMWTELLPELNHMEKAYATRTFPATPSGLCKAYCPVITCVHNGRHA